MTKPHDYRHLDESSKLSLDIDMRELVEKVAAMNYGVHRFLSHLVDVRREQTAARIQNYVDRGDHDVADYARAEGDELADTIDTALARGLY